MATTTDTQPPLYRARTLQWIKAGRLIRNLIMIAFGLAMFGIGLVYCFTTAWSYSWIVGLIVVAGYSVAAVWHYKQPFDREWTARSRFLLCLLALAGGILFFAEAAPSLNLIGMHAPGTISHCEQVGSLHKGTSTVCDATVHWPDGSTDTLGTARGSLGGTYTFVKPPSYVDVLADEGMAQYWPDAVAFVGISVEVILQALYSLLVLLFNVFHGSPTKRRKIAAALPPGQLPV